MKAKLNILILIPNLGSGGAQRVFHQQMQDLSRHFNVLGCVFNWDDSFEEDRVPNIISLNVTGGRTWIHKAYCFIIRIIHLRSIKRKYQIDVSISHLEGADYVNLFSRGSDKVICWIHGTKKFDKNISGPLGLIRHFILMPIVYQRAQRIVTVSKGIQDEFVKSFKGGLNDFLRTIYNGLDLRQIEKKSLENIDKTFVELFQNSKVIITHCRLSRQKNLAALVQIYHELRHRTFTNGLNKDDLRWRVFSTKLVIIGDGELQNELVCECKKHNLNVWSFWENPAWNVHYDVYFLGQQKNPFKYLRHASLYVMTSSWEGFPLALCEAMACQLPVIAADCYTGPREILCNELALPQPIANAYYAPFGVLMPLAVDRSIEMWVDEIQALLENAPKMDWYRRRGKERIMEFSHDSALMQTVELVCEV